MTYRILYTATARADLASQIAYIAEHSLQAAVRWYDGCLDAIESLRSMAERRPVAPEAEAFDREIRQLLYHSHRILFEIIGDTVYVLHIRHGARLPRHPDEGLPRAE